MGPKEGDTPRTRLTHSLEVAQIGRSIAEGLGCDADLVDLAGLAHDIGHPPYGHNGESALNAFAADFGGFEGNAQNLRILTRLEPKVVDEKGESAGLNLTRAALDATIKYPWLRQEGSTKFGAYRSDADRLAWVRAGAPGHEQSLEAQVMDWADDVAYSVHDVEDGVIVGRIDLRALADPTEQRALAELGVRAYPGISAPEFIEAARRLSQLPALQSIPPYDGSIGCLVALKTMTSELVGRFATSVARVEREEIGEQYAGRYRSRLGIPQVVKAEVGLLKTVALAYVMLDPGHERVQHVQRELITEVAEHVLAEAPNSLDRPFVTDWYTAADDEDRYQVVTDQISSYTETRLERVAARINGA